VKKGTDNPENIESLKNKEHPPLTEPTKMVFETNSDKGKIVTFFHNEHNKLFRINCSNCHNQDNCINCHDVNKQKNSVNPIIAKKSLEEHHKPCNSCHAGNSCTKCHRDSEMSPFNHGKSTGWALNSFHSKLECTNCHGNSTPIKKLDRNCTSCHKNFTKGKFDHKVAGLTLSEEHKELDCKDCHINSDFNKAPSCKNCHDDKTYPANSPGIKGKK